LKHVIISGQPGQKQYGMVKGDGQQTRVFYKGNENDFILFLDDVGKLKAWKNDSSVPLVDVVQSFDVFTTNR
jgi:hypothetical protein